MTARGRTNSRKVQCHQRATCEAFRGVVDGFLGNNKDPNYKEIVKTLITSYQKMRCRLLIKLHFLHCHLDFFQENLGDFSEDMVRDFTKISNQWKDGSRAAGTVQ